MTPRLKTRVSKAQKENIGTRNKQKSTGITKKVPRRALADKTNSASDENSIEVPTVSSEKKKTVLQNPNAQTKHITERKDVRPRRDRRVPTRFVESVITALCPKKDNVTKNATVNIAKAVIVKTAKPNTKISSPDNSFASSKSNSKSETSLVVCRPRRICRLPSRFNDHSISPSKFIPLQPQNASTPIPQRKIKVPVEKQNNREDKTPKKQSLVSLPTRSAKTTAINKILNNAISSDTNNNANTKKVKSPSPKRLGRQQNNFKNNFNESATRPSSAAKKVNPRSINDAALKKVLAKNPEMLICNKISPGDKNQDIYEFTFDPEEEPQQQKKKRKKPKIKRAPKITKPKAVVTHKTTYDQNISKALKALKDAVTSKDKPNLPQIQENIEITNISTNSNINDPKISANGGYASIRIEDIAADIEATVENVDLNYSPVNSPKNPVTPIHESRTQQTNHVCNTDPLNLQDDLSFFDDIPVANSSMNTSVRHPLASPWRVEFNNLPIKWPVNAYIKPNMTPAIESSFICSEESNKKKHVYTNMVPENNDPLPVITNTSNLKQPSIISYIKEIAEKKAQMKKKKYESPSKITPFENSLTNENTGMRQAEKKTVQQDLVSDNNTSEEVLSNNNDESNEKENDISEEKANSKEKLKDNSKDKRYTRKRKNNENTCNNKSPEKQNKNCTYFGFDESEDQENLSPVKARDNVRNLRSNRRPVLQELNGPARSVLPVAVKSKITNSSEAVNNAYEGLKSAEAAPVFPDNYLVNITNNDDPTLNDDSQSVHLFEDIEVVHHLKPTRKSYGKNKKLTFQHTTVVDSQDNTANNDSDDGDFGDHTFEIPNVKEKKKFKKKKPKNIMSKKEEKEAEEWAAGFNSMCEEIEEFPLLVE